MTNIIPFSFHGHEVRVVTGDDGEPWWVASDVAKVLGYRMSSDMTRSLDVDEKGTQIVRTPGGPQETTTITESGLYAAILKSRIEGAREFKRWVTHEVLPSIRKRGVYATPQAVEAMLADPDVAIRLLTELKTERARAAELEAVNAEMVPKALFADAVATSHTRTCPKSYLTCGNVPHFGNLTTF